MRRREALAFPSVRDRRPSTDAPSGASSGNPRSCMPQGLLERTQNVLHCLLSHARADSRMPEKRPVIKGAGQHVEDQLYVKAPANLTPGHRAREGLTHRLAADRENLLADRLAEIGVIR